MDEITPIESGNLVTDACQKAQPGEPTVGKKMVNFTQHCELTLALEMLTRHTQRKLTKRKIEISVSSKACCEWYCQYLKLLASAYPNHPIKVRASHAKQPDGWMIPPNGSKSIVKKMAKLIVMKVDSIIWEIQCRLESNSNEFLADFTEIIDSRASCQQAIVKYAVGFTMWNT